MNQARFKTVLVALIVSGLSWTSVAAQGLVPVRGLVEARERGSFGASFILARPVGEFDRFVGLGGGLNLFGVLGVVPEVGLGIRLDASFLVYGNESRRVPLSPTVPLIDVEMSTTNSIASLGIGPQLTVGRGAVSAYGYGLVGFSYFSTFTRLSDLGGGDTIAETTNFDDATFAFTGGGGLRLRISNGAKPVSLDFGVTALRNGDAEYLRSGSIRETADGSVIYTPIRSETNLVNFKLGVTASVF